MVKVYCIPFSEYIFLNLYCKWIWNFIMLLKYVRILKYFEGNQKFCDTVKNLE